MSTTKSQISGDNLGAPVPQSLFRNVQAACGSGPWLFPQPALWPASELLVTAGATVYSAANWSEMYQDLGLKQARDIYAVVKDRTLAAFNPPLVETVVLHGSAVDTAAAYVYSEEFVSGKLPSPPAQTVNGDGDGTVNKRSLLRAAGVWTPVNNANKSVQHFDFPNATHYGMLKDERVLTKLLSLLV